MSSSAELTLQEGWKHYRAEDYAEALRLSIVAANQARNPRYALHLACRCLIESGRYAELLTFLEKIHSDQLHAASVILGVLNAYMLDGRFDLLHKIYEELPETHMAGLLALYHSACAHLGQGDMQTGLEKAVVFRSRIQAFWEMIPFLMDDALNVVYRQVVSLGKRDDIDARPPFSSIETPAVHDIEWATGKPDEIDEEIVYFACADSGYFRGFAGHLLESLNATAKPLRLHLNVMRPDDAIVSELMSIAEPLPFVTLDVSTSQTRNTEPSLYASGRFYLVPELLKAYGVPVVTVDADSRVTARVLDLVRMPMDFDVGFFRTEKVTPASMFDCAIFVSCPTECAREFYRTFLSHIDPLLDGRQRLTWLVDQATIFSLWVYYNEADGDLEPSGVRLVDLREQSGIQDLYEIVPNSSPEEEKDSIRIANSVSALMDTNAGA